MPAISSASASRPGTAAAATFGLRRVRWDRLGRVAMLCVLVALVYLYVSAGVHMLSTWHQARRDSAVVATMEREHRSLTGQRAALTAPGTLETEARQLGMMKPGEQPYVVTGLPNN
ncbi:MAG: Septum formation initiator [Solirubrobacterales bacterium]|nr:Septum formation initiator [Solirubrobacterales bacterium]